MTDSKKNAENRRKLLKSVAAGGGAIIAGKTLPEKWAKPAVDAVMLPAHAQTSRGPYSGSVQTTSIGSDSTFARALDSMVPQAHAAYGYDLSWCILPGTETADVDFLVASDTIPVMRAYRFRQTGVPVGVRTELQPENGCNNSAAWLDKLGLIKDAAAGPATAFVTLSGVNPDDEFRFEWESVDSTEVLKDGPCGPTSVECGPDK